MYEYKMRRVLLAAFIILSGCASQDDLSTLTNGIKDNVLNDMNDPSSFSLVNSEIIDTVRYSDVTNSLLESIESSIDRNEDNLEQMKGHAAEFGELADVGNLISTYEDNLEDLNEEKEIIESFMNSNPDKIDEVAYYRISFSYRETNPMGATILNKKRYEANITESGKVNIIWSADEDVLSELETADWTDDFTMSLVSEIYSGNGRSAIMKEIGLE